MGYAEIAGLPAYYGLYGSIFPILAFSLITTSPQFIVAVDAAPAALVGASIIPLHIAEGTSEAVTVISLITFFTSLWLLLFYFFNLGKLLNFISAPAMAGFISGVGYVWKLSGLPKNKIIGSGTTLDSARLCCELAKIYDLDAKSVEAYIIGEHGDSEVTSWDSATIGGKKIDAVLADNAARSKHVTKQSLQEETIKAGWEIFNHKGNTCYGIAASTTAIVKAVLFNENRIYPVSVCLDGEYGEKQVFLSVPTIINKVGAKEIVELHLTAEEAKAFKESAAIMKSYYASLCI